MDALVGCGDRRGWAHSYILWHVTADLDLIALRGTADLCFAHDFNKRYRDQRQLRDDEGADCAGVRLVLHGSGIQRRGVARKSHRQNYKGNSA